MPGRTFWNPSTITLSPGATPFSITRSVPELGPGWTVRTSTFWSGPTTAIWAKPWRSCSARWGTVVAPRRTSVSTRTRAY